jgi:hypothetical protein
MRKIVIVIVFLSFQFGAKSQIVTDKIIAALDTFAFIQPQEKAYVHTDRNAYITGEPIWLKVYTTLNEKLTILSKIVYVELISNDGKLLEKRMLKLDNGTANAVIDIKPTYPSGNYFIRAYTLWMLNFPGFIIEKKITILNTQQQTKIIENEKKETEIIFEFYPEGGNLISNLNSVVAFKAVDQNNNPLQIKADIFNTQNEKIVSIETQHNGMGKFELTPKENEKYKAVIKYKNKSITKILPTAYSEGVVMAVNNDNVNKTFVSVTRAEKNKALYNNLIVVAQMNYQVVYIGKMNVDEGLDALSISKKNLPAGIMQISLLKENGTPIAERMVFVSNNITLESTIVASSLDTNKSAKNVFTIDVQKYRLLNASISVTNDNARMVSNENIMSALFLSSDVKDKIYNASSYFNNEETNNSTNLDFVMLTNGWRRYRLEDIVNNKFTTITFPFETSLSVIGKVLQADGKSKLKSAKINLIINGEDSTKIMSQSNTNANSAFLIDNLDFKKEATMYYQGSNLSNKEALVTVKFDPNFYDTLKYPAFRNPTFNFNTSTLLSNKYLNNILIDKQKLENGKTLETVVVKSKKKSIVDSLNTQYATDIFYESDQTIPIDTRVNTGSIWQFLRNNISGILVNNTDTGTSVSFTRYEGVNLFGNSTEQGIMFFLNEVPVNLSVIESLFAEDIGLLKVYKGNSAIALGATRGAIALYTVKNKTTRDWRSKGFDFVKKAGYSIKREFPNLDYGIVKPNSADLRTTLYWNPNVFVKDGKATVEFYNDDMCKKFRVTIEGIDADGKVLCLEKSFE